LPSGPKVIEPEEWQQMIRWCGNSRIRRSDPMSSVPSAATVKRDTRWISGDGAL
jgi:hypothetical protein